MDNLAAADPSHLPFAALDGEYATAWHSAPLAGPVGQWLQVDLDTPRAVDTVSLAFVDDLGVGWPVTRFRITTDRGSVEHEVADTLGGHSYYTLPGSTSRVRVTVLAVAGERRDGGVGIRELTIPGTTARRALRTPNDLPTGFNGLVAWSFSRGPADRPACFPTPAPGAGSDATPAAGSVVRCDRFLARAGEEPLGIDRVFRSTTPGSYRLALTAVPRPGGQLTLTGVPVAATVSSYLTGDPAVAGYAAVDGDPGTAWLADIGDLRPTLRLQWHGQRRIAEVRLRPAEVPVGSPPTQVEVRTPGRSQVLPVGADGTVRFPAVRTDQIEIVVRETAARIADRRGNGWTATAGIAEVEIPALKELLRPVAGGTPVAEPCGTGPAVELDGYRYQTAVSTTLADLLAGRPAPVRICGSTGASVDLPAGGHQLATVPSAGFVVQDATLRPEAAVPAPRHRDVTVLDWNPTDRRVRVAPGGEALLAVPENANAGWTATVDGRPLTKTRVDGWQQAWVLPAGDAAEVRLVFAPDRTYRGALAAGAFCALAVLLLGVWPVRRRVEVDGTLPAEGPAWAIGILLVVLLAALGGVLPVAIVLAAMLLRQLARRALPVVVLGGLTVATVTAVAGRLQDHGQEWAYGPWVQAAMLVAVGAVAAAVIPAPGTKLQDEDGTMTR
ncbi:discoidin domain-containing protein [Micromonospora sp. CPCC 205539]|uniref:discoidin domain-containing protein n=1 Tax=Micromonospora sp. CPCC 205539 TaxID=3122408 RepID=UPI002FF3EEE3